MKTRFLSQDWKHTPRKMDFQVLSVFVKQEQDKIITNKMDIHAEIFS